jgi:hypothetical protein
VIALSTNTDVPLTLLKFAESVTQFINIVYNGGLSYWWSKLRVRLSR